MPDFTKIWDKVYLFGPTPTDLSRSDAVFLWLSLVFVVAAVALGLLAHWEERGNPRKVLFGRLWHLFLTEGLLSLLWAGARYENVRMVSAHLVIFMIYGIGLIWFCYIARYFFSRFRKERDIWQEHALKQKYLK